MLESLTLNLAYLACLGAAVSRNSIALRLSMVLACILFAGYFAMVTEPYGVAWNVLFAVFHCAHLTRAIDRWFDRPGEP